MTTGRRFTTEPDPVAASGAGTATLSRVAQEESSVHDAGRLPRRSRRRPGWLQWIAATLALAGLLVVTYPSVAAWFSQYNQSKIIEGITYLQKEVPQDGALLKAHEYNKALNAGAVLQAQERLPSGTGHDSSGLDYNSLLAAGGDGLMGRLKIPSINLDLPIYHGTSDATLLKGVGHLEGTSLPVGGDGTHSVLTAHRGLATATMFSDLDQMKIGQTFTLDVSGQVMTYKVFETQVVEPDETKALAVQPGRDLVTLVTCTPLGINSHRILVTAERILPTPLRDVEAMKARPDIPGFPWWAAWIGGGVVAITLFLVLSTRPRKRVALTN